MTNDAPAHLALMLLIIANGAAKGINISPQWGICAPQSCLQDISAKCLFTQCHSCLTDDDEAAGVLTHFSCCFSNTPTYARR